LPRTRTRARTRTRTHILAPLAVTAVVLIGGCSSSKSSTAAAPGSSSRAYGSSAAAAPTTAAAAPATIGAAAATPTLKVGTTSLGQVLVDASGKTVYLFTKDSGGKSACNTGCSALWPPLTVTGTPVAGAGVDASKLATITRDEGSTQVTYNGSPLYRYTPDTAPGDVKGENVASVWFAVQPDGTKAAPAATAGY